MMKYLLILLFWSNLLLLSAQNFGNEWIDYSKPHFKIKVTSEGIYRIESSAINTYGLNFIDADNFKLFRDGIEVPIYVQQSGSLANFIEFYAYPNDGKLDTRLFNDPSWQLHDRYSLFSDTAVYYLTWNETGGNLRLNNIANDLSNLPLKENYFFYNAEQILKNDFSVGQSYYIGSGSSLTALYNSIFDKGEGFYSASQFNNSSTTLNYNLATPNVYPGVDGEAYAVVVSWTNGAHHFNIKSGSSLLSNHQFNGYEVVKANNSLPANLLGTTTNISFQAVSTGSSSTNRNNPAYVSIRYPRDFDFAGNSKFFFTVQGNGNKQYLEIQNFDEQATYPILYDLTNGLRITSLDAPGTNVHRFALPAASGERKLALRANNSANYTSIVSLEQIDWTNFSLPANQGDYVLLTSGKFINSLEITNYVAHRSSFLGGNHQVLTVDIRELYDQFGFGVDRHPQAIRGFVDYITQNWLISPKYLFIIGKGREYEEIRTNLTARSNCLIPTFGNPGSDVLLAADTSSSVPKIAIGRLAASTNAQIGVYLQKIIDYDNQFYNSGDPYQTLAEKDYMKQIVHLGGGTDLGQQSLFRAYLNSYAAAAKDSSWGAQTTSVFKNSSAPIQTLASELIRNRINDGVSLITFFGHSYSGGFDLSFDDPENYTNTGKYPVFLANGCNSGLIHGGSQSISERFVFQSQKGAIAYLSTTDLSSSSSLNIYTSNFYKNLSKDFYGTSLGEIIKQTVEDVENCCSANSTDLMVAQEMTLHGDPAIPFNQYQKPDYTIEVQNVFFTPDQVSTALDSFTINLVVYNLGKAINDSFNVEVSRIYPNGNQSVQVKRFVAPYYVDTFSMNFPVNGPFNGLGLNNFNIIIDANNEINNELSETNNYLLNQVPLLINSSDIFPIYPYEFAIVPQANITLKASTGNPFEAEKWYVFQIDTSELFNNPLAETRIYSAGGVVEWPNPLNLIDSTVYYWRVSADSIYDGSFHWAYSSFIYLNGQYPGWNQSHYFQWQKDRYETVYLDIDRNFKFFDLPREVYVKTGLYPNLFYEEMEWKMDGAQMHNWKMNDCGGGVGFPNGLSIALIDNVSGVAIPVVNNSTTSSYGPFGNIHCKGIENVITVANFRASGNTPSNHPSPGVPWSDLIISYLNNVPSNYYVLIYSINNPSYASWSPSLVSYLNNLACPISNTTNGPMIFVYQKNNLGFTPIINIGSSFSDIITNTFQINGIWTSGNFKSTLIGPSLKWERLQWDYENLENPSQDIQSVDVIGVDNSGAEYLLFNTPAATLDTSLQSISAAQYPYLRLQMNLNDGLDRTPAQAKYWRVIYDKAPEAAINPKRFFSVNRDTLLQGETWNFAVALENVSEINMDSMSVKNTLIDASNNQELNYAMYDSLPAFDTLHLKFTKSTINNNNLGKNTFILEANPYENNYQLEQFHFNNFASYQFNVIGDNVNPLLDVSFDGRKILDGDLVSAKPEILIQLKDENQFLALDDTSLIDIYFRYLGADGSTPGSLWRVSYNDANTQFIPADLNKNLAKVLVKEEFVNDGKYELIVRSKDKSGNSSSSTSNRLIDLVYYDYKISFEVQNQSSISNVLNYPNPFTTRTQFIFTLTGSEIPEYFEIQIMNIKGTVVKQIRQDELGSIHIGLNKTDYWWDGKDQYGDDLANGVYFYQVKTSLNNESIDHYAIQQVDRFFKKGLGKMVLIR